MLVRIQPPLLRPHGDRLTVGRRPLKPLREGSTPSPRTDHTMRSPHRDRPTVGRRALNAVMLVRIQLPILPKRWRSSTGRASAF